MEVEIDVVGGQAERKRGDLLIDDIAGGNGDAEGRQKMKHVVVGEEGWVFQVAQNKREQRFAQWR